jgi:tRNA pseudouridine55 synthase
MKNKRPDLNGILVVDKPLGWTSAYVCRLIRSRTGGAKVGHAGTLDPLATGVLVICLGRATKRIPDLMDETKHYLATVDLSRTSTTEDLEGELKEVIVERQPSAEAVGQACAAFVGPIMQTPPMHSAVWIDGERAYKKARRGEQVAVRARPVVIDAITIVSYEWPMLVVDVQCRKGTYIRSLARDIGERLGTGGMLTALRRTRAGAFGVEDALSPEQTSDELERHLIPV